MPQAVRSQVKLVSNFQTGQRGRERELLLRPVQSRTQQAKRRDPVSKRSGPLTYEFEHVHYEAVLYNGWETRQWKENAWLR